eukprot:129318-Ditylum_brightwellii.AAC.1
MPLSCETGSSDMRPVPSYFVRKWQLGPTGCPTPCCRGQLTAPSWHAGWWHWTSVQAPGLSALAKSSAVCGPNWSSGKRGIRQRQHAGICSSAPAWRPA